jgi:hypothetical protein
MTQKAGTDVDCGHVALREGVMHEHDVLKTVLSPFNGLLAADIEMFPFPGRCNFSFLYEDSPLVILPYTEPDLPFAGCRGIEWPVLFCDDCAAVVAPVQKIAQSRNMKDI